MNCKCSPRREKLIRSYPPYPPARRPSINLPSKYHQRVPTIAQKASAYGTFFAETNIAPNEIAEKGKSPKKINANGHREVHRAAVATAANREPMSTQRHSRASAVRSKALCVEESHSNLISRPCRCRLPTAANTKLP